MTKSEEIAALLFEKIRKDEISGRLPAEQELAKQCGVSPVTAAKALNIDLAASIMIGDRISDLRAGRAAGCARSVLVKTGYGSNETGKAQQEGFYVAENLADAVKENLKNLLQ